MTKKQTIQTPKTLKNDPCETLTRQMGLSRESVIDDESRLVRLSFSSEEPVLRSSFFAENWTEVLGHDKAEVDLGRLNNSAPLLYNHDRNQRDNRIGVVERAWLENGKGYAEVRLSKRAEVEGIWQDVKDGILRNVSVSYRINKKELQQEHQDQSNLYRVTSWTPMEISLVDIPADPTVGVGRSEPILSHQSHPSLQEHPMPQGTLNNTDTDTQERHLANNTDTAVKQALEQEKQRRLQMRALFEPYSDHHDLRDDCLDNPDMSMDKARTLLLEAIGKHQQPIVSGQRVQVGEEDTDKFFRYADEAIAFRAGLTTPKETKPTELFGYSLMEMARKSLELKGMNTQRLDKRELVGRAFTHSGSDFPKLLENNARKAMLKGYEEAEEVFSLFTRASNLSDFKTHKRLSMGVFDILDEVREGGEYKYGTVSERSEAIQLATYGKMFAITRQAIINDDLNAFTDIPRKMGRAAARTVGDLVFKVITDNVVMSDGLALFHATHNNLAGTAQALTAASVGAARTAMRVQKDGKAVLNIRPKFLLIPAALEDTARVLMSSETDPSKTNSRVPNPVRSAAEIVVDARLDAHSVTAWYLMASPTLFDTIEVGYLDGVAAPFLDSQDGWSVDGTEYKVRIDAAAAPLEYRTMYKNSGA